MPWPRSGHGGLAAGDDAGRARQRLARGGDLAQDAGKHLADLARLALHVGGEQQGVHAQLSGSLHGGLRRQVVAADDNIVHPAEKRVAGLGRVGDRTGAPRCRRVGARPGAACRSGHSRSRMAQASANVVVSGTVGPEAMTSSGLPTTSDRISAATCAGAASAGKLPALDRREMLAHAVDLVDGGAAGQQQLGDGLLVVPG